MLVYICQSQSPNSSHHPLCAPPLPLCPLICSLCLCLYSSPANRFIFTIFLESTDMVTEQSVGEAKTQTQAVWLLSKPLHQHSASYGPQAKTDLLPIFANKALLEHHQASLCIHGCFFIKKAWRIGGDRVLMRLAKPDIFAAAAAKSLQSCATLCDPRDSNPPVFPVPGVLQARTLEWVAISFSNAWKWKVKVKSLSRVQLLATNWS